MSIFFDGISEIHPELYAIDLPRAVCDSAGLSRTLEAIGAPAGPESLNQGQKQYLEASHERDLD
jgi:hypothetical protein